MPKTYATTKGSSGGGGTPGGANTNIQYNDSGAFGGDANLAWDKTTHILSLGGVSNQQIQGASSLTVRSIGDAGPLSLLAGDSTSGSVDGGPIIINSGNALSTARGGSMDINAGQGVGGNGGNTTIRSGSVSGVGNAGYISLRSADAGSNGNGGDLYIGSGYGGFPSGGNGGNIQLFGGGAYSGNGNGGNIDLVPGFKDGSGIDGHVRVQDVNSGKNALLETSSLSSSDKTFTFPNVTGTFNVIPKTGRATAQTAANASVATFTPAADGSFIISANVLVTTATVHSFTVTCAYTDEGNTARTLTLTFSNVGGTLLTAIANAGGTVPYEGIPLHIRAKGGTAITIATTGTFTTVTYNVEGVIQQLA